VYNELEVTRSWPICICYICLSLIVAADAADSSSTSEKLASAVVPMIPLPTFVWAHDPVTVQLRGTPIPLHVTVNPGVVKDIGVVILHFQFQGQEQWHSKAMVLRHVWGFRA
jgi:hypothetical protein